jgi:hypothetical protein
MFDDSLIEHLNSGRHKSRTEGGNGPNSSRYGSLRKGRDKGMMHIFGRGVSITANVVN